MRPKAFPAVLSSLSGIFLVNTTEGLDMERFLSVLHPLTGLIDFLKLPTVGSSVLESTAGSFTQNNDGVLVDEKYRLEKIMDEIFKMGFDNLEAVVIAYYTLDLDENSTIGPAQRFSRRRHIRSLILELSHSSGSWPEEEARPLQEEILKAAVALYAAEVKHLKSLHWPDSNVNLARLWEDAISGRCEDSGIETIIPEIWSLLTRLVQQLGVLPSVSKRIVWLLVMLLYRLSDLKF
ncbi:transcription factor radR [Colletotrichum liriopes]|uniref:Transcription factor radR n=1 Tax=Colletotrichum liriopes TaxID=708192 RepID=A0AA37GZK3_9PEZI|nr:transcription factor radR [Colletotrichum liriopes]